MHIRRRDEIHTGSFTMSSRYFIIDWSTIERHREKDTFVLFAKTTEGEDAVVEIDSASYRLYIPAVATSPNSVAKFTTNNYFEYPSHFTVINFDNREQFVRALQKHGERAFVDLPTPNRDDLDVAILAGVDGPGWYDLLPHSGSLVKASEEGEYRLRTLIFDPVIRHDKLQYVTFFEDDGRHGTYFPRDIGKALDFVQQYKPDVVGAFDLGRSETLEKLPKSLTNYLFSKDPERFPPLFNGNEFRGYGVVPVDLSQLQGVTDTLDEPKNHGSRSFEVICSIERCRQALHDLKSKSIIETHLEICETVGISPTCTRYDSKNSQFLKPSRILASCMYREAIRRNVVFPSVGRPRSDDTICGGTVLKPVEGFWVGTVEIRDFKSAYPSIAVAFNVDSTTLLRRSDDGLYEFVPRSKRVGLFSSILERFLQKREACGTDERKSRVFKFCANSCIGGMALKSRLPFVDGRVYEAIVTRLKRLLNESIRACESFEHMYLEGSPKTLYGDTDSIFSFFPTVNSMTDDKYLALFSDADRHHRDYISLIHGKEIADRVRFEFQAHAKALVLSRDKKRYAALLRKRNDKFNVFHDWTVDLKGITRRDAPCTVNRCQKDFFNILFKTFSVREAFNVVESTLQSLRSANVLNCNVAQRRSCSDTVRDTLNRQRLALEANQTVRVTSNLIAKNLSTSVRVNDGGIVNALVAAALNIQPKLDDCERIIRKTFVDADGTWGVVLRPETNVIPNKICDDGDDDEVVPCNGCFEIEIDANDEKKWRETHNVCFSQYDSGKIRLFVLDCIDPRCAGAFRFCRETYRTVNKHLGP